MSRILYLVSFFFFTTGICDTNAQYHGCQESYDFMFDLKENFYRLIGQDCESFAKMKSYLLENRYNRIEFSISLGLSFLTKESYDIHLALKTMMNLLQEKKYIKDIEKLSILLHDLVESDIVHNLYYDMSYLSDKEKLALIINIRDNIEFFELPDHENALSKKDFQFIKNSLYKIFDRI